MRPAPVILSLAALLLSGSVSSVEAQTAQQQWTTNQANQVQQAANSGMINGNQAANLEYRDQEIQNQEQRDLQRNGGTLTPQEQQRIDHEMRSVNQHMRQDARADNPNGMPNGSNSFFPAQQWMNGGWNNNNPNFQNANNPYHPGTNGYYPNGYPVNQNGYPTNQNQGWQSRLFNGLNPAANGQNVQPGQSSQPGQWNGNGHHHHRQYSQNFAQQP